MITVPLNCGLQALVDDEDEDKVVGHSWTCLPAPYTTYAVAVIAGKRVFMHRAILGTPESSKTDHRDLNGLNNQKENLRPATRSQNGANARRRKDNTSGYKGVRWHTQSGKWRAMITKDGKTHSLGLYRLACDAALAYDRKALELFGEFALTNTALGLITK